MLSSTLLLLSSSTPADGLAAPTPPRNSLAGGGAVRWTTPEAFDEQRLDLSAEDREVFLSQPPWYVRHHVHLSGSSNA